MSDTGLRSAVMRAVLAELAAAGEYWAPVAASGRHCHLSRADLERLFGPGHELTPMRMLEQPGQFAAEEKVVLETPKGKMTLRVVGPVRKESQVELSLTDARQMGLSPPVRLSGDLEGSPGCRLVNGGRTAELSRGVIAAARHLHMSAAEALAYGLRDGEEVSIRSEGPRGAVLDHVIVRSGSGHVLEAHIDTDEANAFGIRSGQLCRLILPGRAGNVPGGGPAAGAGRFFPGGAAADGKVPAGAGSAGAGGLFPGGAAVLRTFFPAGAAAPGGSGPGAARTEAAKLPAEPARRKEILLDYSGKADLLLTEELLYRAAEQGMKFIRLSPGALVTPLARDVAWEKGIELIYPDGKNERR